MKNLVILFVFTVSTTIFLTNCSRYESSTHQDLSNDVVNESPKDIKEEDKEEMKQTLNNDDLEVDDDMPIEKGVQKVEKTGLE